MDLAVEIAVDDLGERVGEIDVGIDAVELDGVDGLRSRHQCAKGRQ